MAEQSFGFWTSLFEPHHFRLVRGAPLTCFVSKPAAVNRSVLAAKLDGVRNFRNRIYHNEPICFKGSLIDFSDTEAIWKDIQDMLSWMDPELTAFVTQFEELRQKIQEVRSL